MEIGISALLPCFNGAKFIDSALDSIAKQTFPVKEIIFVDDGSSDSSREIASAWKSNNYNFSIHIISQKNRGVSVARNVAAEYASSEWLSLLDVDDIWYPQHNEILAELALIANDCPMVFCDSHRTSIRPNGEEHLPTCFEISGLLNEINAKGFRYRHKIGGSLHRKLLTGSFIPTCSNLFRKSAFDKVGGFESKRAFAEDRMFWLKIFNIGPVICSTKIAGRKRYHDNNTTHPRNQVMELLQKISLVKNISNEAILFGIGPDELEILQNYYIKVLGQLRYASSSQGLRKMLEVHRELRSRPEFKFSTKDWARGVARSLMSRMWE